MFDPTPHEHLIRAHLKKFRSYCWSTLSRDDLMQVGRMALLRAHEKFDPSKGVKFETYANYWVKQALFKECAEHGYPVRYPTESWRKLKIKNGARPGWAKSLDAPANEDGDARKDLIPDRKRVAIDEEARKAQIAADATEVMSEVLSAREVQIVWAIANGEPLTASGARLGVSRERVRQLYARSIERVRNAPRVAMLEDYLETA